MTSKELDAEKTVSGGGNLEKIVVVTRSSPYIHTPHNTLSDTITAKTGGPVGYAQVTYYEPPAGTSSLAGLAHLTERSLVAIGSDRVLVSDWDRAAGERIISFLSGWPSLRSWARFSFSALPKRARRGFGPVVVTDGLYPWCESYRFRDLINKYFAHSVYQLLALPGGPNDLGAMSPKLLYLKKQLEAVSKTRRMDGIILLPAFPFKRSVEHEFRVGELRRSFAMVKNAFPDQKVLAASVLLDDNCDVIDIDNSPLVS